MTKKKRGNVGPVDPPAKKISKLNPDIPDYEDEADESKAKLGMSSTSTATSTTVNENEGSGSRVEKVPQVQFQPVVSEPRQERAMLSLSDRWTNPARLEYLSKLRSVKSTTSSNIGTARVQKGREESNPLLINVVLSKVFTYLSNDVWLLKLRLVCKKWDEEIVVQSRKSKKFHVKLGSTMIGEHAVTRFNEDMEATVHFPFGHMYFGCHLSKSNTNKMLLLFQKYGEYFRKIEFALHVVHYMSQAKFAAILSTLTNLEELVVTGLPGSIGTATTLSSELQKCALRKLKRLKVYHPGHDTYAKSMMESEYSPEFLSMLFRISPNINTLRLYWPTDSKSGTITNFMTAMSRTYTGSETLSSVEINCAMTENHIKVLNDCKLKLESLLIGYLDQNVERRTFEELLKKQKSNLKQLDLGDGSYETPEQFVWARGEALSLAFPCMEKLETLILKCDGTHEFRKLGFTQICFRTQFPALKTLRFLESPGAIDYIQKFLLPLPLALSLSQKSYTITKLQISGSLRLIRKGFFTRRNYVKLLSRRFPALKDLHIYFVTTELIPYIWKYFKRIETLTLIISGSEDASLDAAITGVDMGVCKWLSKHFSESTDTTVDQALVSSIVSTRKRSICDLKKLQDLTIDVRGLSAQANSKVTITDSVIYFSLMRMRALQVVSITSYDMTDEAVEDLEQNKCGKKLRKCQIKILPRPEPSNRDESEAEVVSSESDNDEDPPPQDNQQNNDDFVMALAVNYNDFEQDEANNSEEDDEGGQANDDWDNGSNSDFGNDNDSNADPAESESELEEELNAANDAWVEPNQANQANENEPFQLGLGPAWADWGLSPPHHQISHRGSVSANSHHGSPSRSLSGYRADDPFDSASSTYDPVEFIAGPQAPARGPDEQRFVMNRFFQHYDDNAPRPEEDPRVAQVEDAPEDLVTTDSEDGLRTGNSKRPASPEDDDTDSGTGWDRFRFPREITDSLPSLSHSSFGHSPDSSPDFHSFSPEQSYENDGVDENINDDELQELILKDEEEEAGSERGSEGDEEEGSRRSSISEPSVKSEASSGGRSSDKGSCHLRILYGSTASLSHSDADPLQPEPQRQDSYAGAVSEDSSVVEEESPFVWDVSEGEEAWDEAENDPEEEDCVDYGSGNDCDEEVRSPALEEFGSPAGDEEEKETVEMNLDDYESEPDGSQSGPDWSCDEGMGGSSVEESTDYED